MRAKKSSKARPRKHIATRILKLLLALIVVLIVLVFFLVPAFVSSEKCRQIILAKINNSIAGQTDFSDLSMGWFKGIKVADFSFNDSTNQISVQVKQITTKPHYGYVLTGKLFKKIDLVLNDGNLKVIDSEAETIELSHINSTLTISLSGEYSTGQTDKLLANLTVDAKLGFEQAGYIGLDFGPTDVDIQIRNGLLKIAPFTTTVNDGRFNFSGQVDFNQKPILLKIAEPMQVMKGIKVNDQTTKRLLRYLNPVFANAVNVSGIANFSCEQLAIPLSTADEDHIEVVGTISIDQLHLQASDLLGQILSGAGTGSRGTDITIHPTKFILRDGFLRYDNMQMDVGDNPVNFKGVIGLDKSLDMTVTLPYTTGGRTARLGRETIGQRITLPLKGTIDKPELDIGKLLEGQLRQQLEDQLRKGLEELFK